MPSLPKVTQYMDALQYLHDYYTCRKSLDAKFSYQNWASEIGFKNRSFLRLVVTGGRHITESTRCLLEEGLGLHGVDREYFACLVSYTQEQDESKKRKWLQRMMEIVRVTHDQQDVGDHEEFLANPLIPVLQVLLSFEDLERTPVNLAHVLGAELETTRQWLFLLERLGLARRDDEDASSWRACTRNFRVPERLGSRPLQKYHASVLNRAIDAVSVSPEQRRFRTIIVALSEEEYSDFCTKMNEFAVNLLSRYSHLELKDRDLYFFTKCLFPVRTNTARADARTVPDGGSSSMVEAEGLT